MNDVARRTKVVDIRYFIQEKIRSTWTDWGRGGTPIKRDAQRSMRYYRKEYPHITFRLVKRTTTEEVVDG